VVAAAVAAVGMLAAGPAWADELVVDNTDGSVQTKGNWTTTTTTQGFYGSNYLFRTSGDGSSTVVWPFPQKGAAGKYEVFARWSSGPNRATDATYQVAYNGGTSPVKVNQQNNGGNWQSLGSFDFQPGKSQGVTLTDKASGVVVADAIRFVGPGGGAQQQGQPQQQAATQATPPTPPPAQSSQPAPVTGSGTGGGGAGTSAGATGTSGGAPTDPRYFSQTRYRIAEDAFWDYFRRRGAEKTFGYPVSNTFVLFGMKTEIFQRQVMQLRPEGGVQTMNLLDEGLMPYTKMNGSTFPAPDDGLKASTPKVSDPNYGSAILDFVRANAPDTFDGEPVNFEKTFFSTVTADQAGTDDPNIVGLLNLEIWGAPTSKPAHDPTNPGFIYQRFQRGIMHYDKGCGCTQGLLLADYFKAILTNRNLPGDLADQAKSSKLLGQFAPDKPQGLARPNDLPGANLTDAFRRDGSITLDAGHGGSEIGTSHTYPDGLVIQEKALNLRVMLRVRDLLQQAGYQVIVTRTTDAQVNSDRKDVTGDGQVGLDDDLQARVDAANRAGSDIFVSIHFNGIADPNIKGTYVFFDPDRPYADRSKALAASVDAGVTKALKDAGYTTVDHGATTDTSVLGGAHYYLLSPKTDIVARPSQMPAIIGESLFLTNTDDANAVRNDAIVEAIARGYLEGIKGYFAKYPPS
jgi:N-acetylmuramoyl-L-alanine amidase